MPTYRYSRTSRIFYYLIGVPFSLGLLFTPWFIWVLSEKLNPVFFVFFGGLAFCLGIYFFRGIFVMTKGEFTITGDFISYKAIWKTTTLPITEVLGYREVESRLQVIPKKGTGKKKLKVNKDLENYNLIKQWITETLNNIDETEAREELSEVITDPEHGATEEARIARLIIAKRVSSVFNIVGIVIAIWIGFVPTPYRLIAVLAITFPLIIVLVASSFRGLITISERTNSKLPTMMYGFLFVCLALMIRGMLDYNLLTYTSEFWINACGFTVAMLLVLLLVDRDFRPAFRPTFFGLLLAYSALEFSYSVGSVTILNCHFDSSKATVTTTRVVSKNSEVARDGFA
jgi:uncharacterized membrane protein